MLAGMATVEEALREVVARLGPAVAADPRLCRAALADFGVERRLIAALAAVAEVRATPGAVEPRPSEPVEVRLERVARVLHDDQALDLGLARWAAQAWADALGESEEPAQPGTSAATAPSWPTEIDERPGSIPVEATQTDAARAAREAARGRQDLVELFDSMADTEIRAAWPVVQTLVDFLPDKVVALMAWAIEEPVNGLLLATDDGVLICANDPDQGVVWWTRKELGGASRVDGHRVVVRLRDPESSEWAGDGLVRVRLVEDEADLVEIAIDALVRIRSRVRLLEFFENWDGEA